MEGKELQRVAASKAANTLAPASLSDKIDVDSSEKNHHPSHKLLLSMIQLFLNTHLLRRPSHSRRTSLMLENTTWPPSVSTSLSSLVGIGQHDESKISCDFTPYSFDLIATD